MESSDHNGNITPHLIYADNSINEKQDWLSSQAISQTVNASTPTAIVKAPFGQVDPNHCGSETPGVQGSKLTSFGDSLSS